MRELDELLGGGPASEPLVAEAAALRAGLSKEHGPHDLRAPHRRSPGCSPPRTAASCP